MRNQHAEETLRRVSQLETSIKARISCWKNSNPSSNSNIWTFPTISHDEIKSLKFKKEVFTVVNVVSIFLGIFTLSSIVKFYFSASTKSNVLISVAAFSFFAFISHQFLDSDFSAKKRVIANRKFKVFTKKFIISEKYQTSLQSLMEKTVQGCYQDWKTEMKILEIFYHQGKVMENAKCMVSQ